MMNLQTSVTKNDRLGADDVRQQTTARPNASRQCRRGRRANGECAAEPAVDARAGEGVARHHGHHAGCLTAVRMRTHH